MVRLSKASYARLGLANPGCQGDQSFLRNLLTDQLGRRYPALPVSNETESQFHLMMQR